MARVVHNGWERMRAEYKASHADAYRRRAAAMKELRAWRKANGWCVRCGKEYAAPGLTLCVSCRLAVNQRASGVFMNHSVEWHRKERVAGRE